MDLRRLNREVFDFTRDLMIHSLRIVNFPRCPDYEQARPPRFISHNVRNSVRSWIKPSEFSSAEIQFLSSASRQDIQNYLTSYLSDCKSKETSGYYKNFDLVAFIIHGRTRLAQSLTFSQWTDEFFGEVVLDLAFSLNSLFSWIQSNGGWLVLKEYCDANPV